MMFREYQKIIFSLVLIGISGMLFIISFKKERYIPFVSPLSEEIALNDEKTSKWKEKILWERNVLSISLNKEKQKLGQLQCKVKNQNVVGEEQVADSGGYCQEEGSVHKRKAFTDTKLTKQISTLLKGKRVGAFGDGPGMYKKSYDDIGLLEVYDSYDGAPFIENETNGKVKFIDLTIPQYGLPIYDWVICLEVAEHIPKDYEDVFLSNLARHAQAGIILSWARPGQPGHYHVNNKPLDQVIVSLRKVGFERDEGMSRNLQNNARNGVFKQNLNVYIRDEKYSLVVDDA